MAVETVKQDRSLSQLFTDLTNETRHLFSQEVALARAEVSETVSNYTRYAMWMAAAGALAYAALLALIAAAALGASVWFELPLWASCGIVGGLLLIVALILFVSGRSGMRRESPVPTRTIETLKENVEWAKQHAR
jgi:hypothetical protein